MEYLNEFEQIPTARQMTWFGTRNRLVEKYSWAVPNDAAIQRLVELSPIVELGAGNGYWAYEVQRHGGSVDPYDLRPPKETWTPVTKGDETVLEGYEEPLFLCWPPLNEMATDALYHHSGETVIYIGESSGGCTAEKTFHSILEDEYRLREVIDIPSFDGVHDNMYIYERWL